MKYYVYIITNHTNTVLYIGLTNNLERRIYEHKHQLIDDSFSKKYKLYKLIWFQEFNQPKEAIEAEKKIKGWTRIKKMDLVKKMNPEFLEITLR